MKNVMQSTKAIKYAREFERLLPIGTHVILSVPKKPPVNTRIASNTFVGRQLRPEVLVESQAESVLCSWIKRQEKTCRADDQD